MMRYLQKSLLLLVTVFCLWSCRKAEDPSGSPEVSAPQEEVPPQEELLPQVDKSEISQVPVNQKATESAKKLYRFLWDNYGEMVISGGQSSMSHTNDYIDAVYASTGTHPALAGYDFIFLQFSPTPENWSWKQDYTDISNQKAHWNAGGIITYMWHWNVPKDEQVFRSNDTSEGNFAFYTSQTDFDIREALKEGTWQHECILANIDEIAVTLKKLQDEGIPVLFRPLHEAAGSYTRWNSQGGAWFWWGRYGASYCKQLWALLRERLENHHGLNNLLWVWTIDVMDGYLQAAREWYPGNDQVDIVGADIYADDNDSKLSYHQFMEQVTDGRKLMAVTECGNIPDPYKNLKAGAPWSWFMVWAATHDDGSININASPLNTNAYWKSLMSSEYVYTRESINN